MDLDTVVTTELTFADVLAETSPIPIVQPWKFGTCRIVEPETNTARASDPP